MNIWYINHYSGGPNLGRAFRPFNLAKNWLALNCNVTVITSSYNHLQYKHAKTTSLTSIDGVPFQFIKSPRYQGNGIGRLINMLMFALGLFFKVFTAKHTRPDVIIYSSPHLFGFISAYLLAKLWKVPCVLEVRDIWPMSLVELVGVSKSHPLVRLFKRIEAFAYNKADAVVSSLSDCHKHITNIVSKSVKFHWAPNGIDFSTQNKALDLPQGHNDALLELKRQGYFIAGYAGAFGQPNALGQFINAASYIQTVDPKIHLVFVGEGQEKSKLVEQVNSLGLKNVTFLTPVEKACVPKLLQLFDCGLIGWHKTPLYEYGISPNKIFDYMQAKLPIVHALDSDADPVKNYNAGLNVTPFVSEGIGEAIIELKKKEKPSLAQMGENGYRYLAEYHDFKKVSQHYLTFLKTIKKDCD